MKDQADNLRKAIEKLSPLRLPEPGGAAPRNRNGGAATFRNGGGAPLRRRNIGPTRVYAVASGKGGVGKTSVSVNLALALCEQSYKTLIIDADIGLANVEVLFGLTPGASLMDSINGDKPIREIIFGGPIGVNIISGGAGMEELARMDESSIAAFAAEISELDDEYDAIIIDTGAGISENVLGTVMAADELIIVTTPEPTSLTDAYALIKAIALRDRAKTMRIIINRAENEAEAGEIASKLTQVSAKFLDLKIHKLGYILNDPLVVRSIKRQNPFFIYSPYSQTSKSIREIALRLMDGAALAPTDKNRGLSGFFDRIAKFVSMQLK